MCSDACCPEGTCDTAPECVRKVTCEDEDGDETDDCDCEKVECTVVSATGERA